MVPIQDLLNRIRWDPAFGADGFTIGYYDRLAHRIVTVPLKDVALEPGNHFSFIATDPDGSLHDVPFHRVREVHRNNELIWHRTLSGEPNTGEPSEHEP
jgi:uncharacterized protein (UPF0248 family)